jgi:glycoside/pentoside/hexuronide:cation symporter, GPH family
MRRAQLIAYGALGAPVAFAALPVYVYAPKFYALLGVSLAVSGAILLLARIADALIDPWLGSLADRVRSRKLMIGLALLPLMAGMVALFHPPANSSRLVTWMTVSLVLVYLGYSAASIAYQAWGARVAGDSAERTKVTAWREGFGLVGVVLASLAPQLFAPTIEAGLPQAAWLFVAISLVCAAVTLGTAPAGSSAHSAAAESGLVASLKVCFSSRACRRLLLVFALNGIASAIPATLFLFFVADRLKLESQSGVFLAAYFVAAACSLPLWTFLSNRLGKAHAWGISMGLAILAFVWAMQLGAGDFVAFMVIAISTGVALGADLALPASMLADVIEDDQSVGREGAYFGVWNLFTKLNLALAAGLSLPLLAWAGYAPGTQSSAGLAALTFAYCAVPCVLKALALLALMTSPILKRTTP